MSYSAQNFIELQRLAQGGAGALTQHLLREMATNIIAPGVASASDTYAEAALQCNHFLHDLAVRQDLYVEDFEISELLHLD